MSEFDEKLNEILSSPETMAQIAALANSLSGGKADDEPEPSGTGAEETARTAGGEKGPDFSGLGSLLSGLDPSLLGRFLPLIQEYTAGDGERQALLAALKPFLKEESQAKIEKAIRITRLSRVIRSSMQLFRENGHV